MYRNVSYTILYIWWSDVTVVYGHDTISIML